MLMMAKGSVSHNPFSIQVYYYWKTARPSYLWLRGHNPFSIQVYYYASCLNWPVYEITGHVTIPFQFRSIITSHRTPLSARTVTVRHNPFSIQVYYYRPHESVFSVFAVSGHNPFSIQVYYYRAFAIALSILSSISRHNPFSIQVYYYGDKIAVWLNGAAVTIPFQFRSIITHPRTIRITSSALGESQSLFNSGLLLQGRRNR